MILRAVLAALLAFGALVPCAAWAQAFSCQADTTPALDFGRPGANPTATVDTAATPTLRVTCTGWYNATIKVCVGINAGSVDGALAPRRLGNGGARLSYQIYGDAARTQVVGPMAGSGSAGPLEASVTLNQNPLLVFGSGTVEIPLYGRVFPDQSGLAAGTYQSNLTVQVDSVAGNGTCRGTHNPEDTLTMNARAVLPGSCSIVADDLNFGTRASLASAVDASTTLTVTCTSGTAYAVRLDGGRAGNIAARRMYLNGSGPQAIAYDLYTHAARTQPWGDGSVGAVVEGVGAGTGLGTPQVLTVYGRVPAQATPVSGTYRDVVTATVEY
ncbi:Csu type fimbrial protein [Vulcaniibacterium tengchongense]|uniref:Spore coat protein U-like protein n=1 Tax=Vulcaniibacterium tengchongense TaxID=1273429 RepID=A0A3N4W2C2_9GAMM|nr:spore coat U domain-containing protein [Vulcaniibacterium tengchongense]RPE80220.1 spore coat protein U-like protein [Vulcaniibacterium tengchongense]